MIETGMSQWVTETAQCSVLVRGPGTFGTELGATLATRPGALGVPELGSPSARSEIPNLGFRKHFVVYQDMLVRMRGRGKM